MTPSVNSKSRRDCSWYSKNNMKASTSLTSPPADGPRDRISASIEEGPMDLRCPRKSSSTRNKFSHSFKTNVDPTSLRLTALWPKLACRKVESEHRALEYHRADRNIFLLYASSNGDRNSQIIVREEKF